MYTKHDGLSVLTLGNTVSFLCKKQQTRRGLIVPNAPNVKNPNIFTIMDENNKYKSFNMKEVAYVEAIA